MAACPIKMSLKKTGSATSTVCKDIFEGFCNVVVRGVIIYSFPPFPPLPVTEMLLKLADPPKELIPGYFFDD